MSAPMTDEQVRAIAERWDGRKSDDGVAITALLAERRALLADVAALRREREALRTALADLVTGLDWWRVDEYDREFPAEELRDARSLIEPEAR